MTAIDANRLANAMRDTCSCVQCKERAQTMLAADDRWWRERAAEGVSAEEGAYAREVSMHHFGPDGLWHADEAWAAGVAAVLARRRVAPLAITEASPPDPLADPRVRRLVEAARGVLTIPAMRRDWDELTAALAPFRASATGDQSCGSSQASQAASSSVSSSASSSSQSSTTTPTAAEDIATLADGLAALCVSEADQSQDGPRGSVLRRLAAMSRALAAQHRAQAAAARDVAAAAQVVGKVYTARSTRDAWLALSAWAATMAEAGK